MTSGVTLVPVSLIRSLPSAAHTSRTSMQELSSEMFEVVARGGPCDDVLISNPLLSQGRLSMQVVPVHCQCCPGATSSIENSVV